MHSGLNLRLLRPPDWRTLRDVRLAALQDSPHAFTSHYVQELGWSEREWRRTLKALPGWLLRRQETLRDWLGQSGSHGFRGRETWIIW